VDARPQEILYLEAGGVRQWLDDLESSDESSYDMIVQRLERVEEGNFGDCGPVGSGVSELRFIRTGPGYRIYFGQHNDMVILLRAGVKKTQDADIEAAKALWTEYKKHG
jgi:putative addiction module killer protein